MSKVMKDKMITSKEHFIDPKWSMSQVQNHLKETVFSEDNMAPAKLMVSQHFFQNRRKFNNWETERNEDDLYLILPQLDYIGKYPIHLLAVPYFTLNNKEVKIMYLAIFYFRNNKNLATIIENDVIVYSWHCVERYVERVLGIHASKASIRLAAEMLIYNNMSWIRSIDDTTFPYRDYDIVRDGMYGCENKNGVWVRKTLITPDYFWPAQVRFYNQNVIEENKTLIKKGIPPINWVLPKGCIPAA